MAYTEQKRQLTKELVRENIAEKTKKTSQIFYGRPKYRKLSFVDEAFRLSSLRFATEDGKKKHFENVTFCES